MSYTLNRTGAQIDAIGDIVNASSSLTTISSDTATNMASITLPAGTWVIVGQLRIQGGSGFRISASISTSSAAHQPSALGGYVQQAVTSDVAQFSTNIVRILSIATSQTAYLVCTQNSGSAKTVYPDSCTIAATRLK